MMVLADRDNRHYLAFLGAVALLCVVLALVFGWGYGRSVQGCLLAQEERVATALLADGVPQTVVAAALANDTVPTAEAQQLLATIGHDSSTAPWLFDDVRAGMLTFGGLMLATACLIGALIIIAAAFYLSRQERRYLQAAEIIGDYSNGTFSQRLPKNEAGALSQLFGAVEELALSLVAKSENEQRVKEFLKSMISDISHQVKTPLAALRIYTEIIGGEPENADTVRTFAAKSERALDRLEQLIQSLLRLTRLDAGSVDFVRRPERLMAVVEQALEPLSTRALREGKTITIAGESETVLICDAAWTAEAVGNLVKNALDHTPSGGHIRISWERGPALLRLAVSDDGEGIAPEDIHHIFKRFYRHLPEKARPDGHLPEKARPDEHPIKERAQTGVGLGLPIAKSIVEGQGGSLSVASTPGEGTTFTMAFPVDTLACGIKNDHQTC